MRKATFLFSVIFAVLSLVGVGYVLYNGGEVSAGYAFIPMVLAVICISSYRNSLSK